ncbi:MAG: type II toxin-antitoxin system RelE/ParE family toxin [Thaumarchaeota archaeon]|nr:type II toxin-antitoxin system RelE/ParE family toxin [Nitrososphaerota archaeon]
MWKFEIDHTFKSRFKNLSPELQKRVKDALLELANVDNPGLLGVYKPHLYGGSFSYHVGRNYRIIYRDIHPKHVIELIHVGDHKQSYGND